MSNAAQTAKAAGNIAFQQQNYELALSHYSAAIQINPSEFTFFLNRSATYLKMEKWKEAERDAGIALDLEPSCVKALFRRATARRELKCYATAKADLEMAVELGGGTEIQAELERVEQELAKVQPSVATSQKEQLVASTPAPTSASPSTTPSTSRLRGALSSFNSASPSVDSTSSSSSDNSLMKEVSTRRTPKSSSDQISSFAAKKEKRDERTNQLFSAASIKPLVDGRIKRVENNATKQIIQPPVVTPPPAVTTSLSSVAIPSIPPSIASPIPTTVLAFESTWSSLLSAFDRKSFLRSISPPSLAALFGDNLTPELLEDIISSLLPSSSDASKTVNEEDRDWIIPFLRGMRSVKRFSAVVGFLEEKDKVLLKKIIDQAREEIEHLGVAYEI